MKRRFTRLEKKDIYQCAKYCVDEAVVITLQDINICRKYFTDQGSIFLVICPSIGDTLITLGYLKEFRKCHPCKKLIVVNDGRYRELYALYRDLYERWMIISTRDYRKMRAFGNTRFSCMMLEKYFSNVVIVTPAVPIINEKFGYLANYPNINFFDSIKYGILNLDENAEYIHKLKKKSDISQMNANKKIILCSESNFFHEIDALYFTALKETLSKKQYDVSINDKKQKNILDFFNSLDCNTWVVGMRSGILDIAAESDACILEIYPSDCSDNLMSFFSLANVNHTAGKKIQYRIGRNEDQNLFVSKIEKLLCEEEQN